MVSSQVSPSARSSSRASEAGRERNLSDGQVQNAPLSIRETLEGASNMTDDSDRQPLKADRGRRETFEPDSKTTMERSEQDEKQSSPRISIDDAIRTDDSEQHNANAPRPIRDNFDPGGIEKLPR
jgi:hypothetical protein